MLKMSQINYIRDLHNCGYSAKEIQEKTNADPKTIRKYLNQDDFSLKLPIKKANPSISSLKKLFIHGSKKIIMYIPDELLRVAIQMEYTLALPPISC